MASLAPISMPTTPAPRDAVWKRVVKTGMTESPYDGKQHIQANDFSQWQATFSYPPMNYETAKPWLAFFAKLNGVQGTFYASHPDFRTSVANNGTLNANVNAGATTADVRLHVNDGRPSEGDYVSFGSAETQSLHIITGITPRISSDPELFRMTVAPPVRRTHFQRNVVNFTNPTGIFRMMTNTDMQATNLLGQFSISFSFKEAG